MDEDSMTNDLVLAELNTARTALAKADTIQKTKNVLDVAVAAETYAKRQKLGEEAINLATSIKVEALRQLGHMLKETPRAKGGDYGGETSDGNKRVPSLDAAPTLAEMGLDKKTSKLAQDIAALPEEQFEAVRGGILTLSRAVTETKRKEVRSNLESIEQQQAKELIGVYDVVVIDPPWAMEKIEREVRQNQTAFDYPTMELEEIGALSIPCADDCHVFLWTTQRFLPDAFRLFQAWGFKYTCTFNWHKKGGFQVVGLPQYNNEFVLYGRKGTPSFVDTKAFKTSFEGERRAHSEKPEEFYETLRRVTAGRRLDMFNRRKIEGFDGWGKESL
jgi:N6-adenosine-specific RNA methylase IME4